MKIGFDAKRFFHNTSGLGNYSRDLVRILATYNLENEYHLFATKESNRAEEILALENVGFNKIGSSIASRQLNMGKEAQNFGCDIFHGLSGELPLFWNNKPIKKIVTIHDLIFLRYPQFYSFFDRNIYFIKFKNAVNQADKVIAISQQTKKDIVDFLKISPEKITVVHQGCNHQFKEETSLAFSQEVKLKYQLPEKFILNVGTIEERKNLFRVVKSILGTDIPLVVVGKKTKYCSEIENFIVKNKMQQQVHFLKDVAIKELAAIYKLTTIFVYPSLFEGFGIPIIEALFSKTPVITSNTSCFPEAGGDFSVYVDPLNETDIKEKILFLWNNEEERNIRAEKSFNFVQKFNDQQVAKELMQVYNNLL